MLRSVYFFWKSLIITTLFTFLMIVYRIVKYFRDYLTRLSQKESLNQINETGRNLKYLVLQKKLPRVQTSRTTEEHSFPYFDRYSDDIVNIDSDSTFWRKSKLSGFSSDDSNSDCETVTSKDHYLNTQRIVRNLSGSYKNIKTKLTSKVRTQQHDTKILEQLWYNDNVCKKLTREESVLPEEYQRDFQHKFMKPDDMQRRLPSAENYVNAAFVSRILVFTIQCLAFNFVPHHNNDGFRFTPEEDYGTFADKVVNSTFAGLANWDGQYFLHISTKGYTEESFMAFFPLFPMTVYVPSKLFYLFLFPIMSFSSIALVVGIVLNLLFFVISVEILHDITRRCDRGLDNLSQFVVLLYCYNPASIFFSAFYTESMFSILTMGVLHSLLTRKSRKAVVLASLSSLCRSNGILNFGFVAAFIIRNALCDFRQPDVRKIINIIIEFLLIVIGMIPFALFQLYGVRKFCDGREVTSQLPEYCRNHFVLPYQYVQRNYWNVGLLNYFELKQIPNFLLAAPVIFVMLFECIKRMRTYVWYIFENKCYDTIGDLSMTLHGLFLAFFCFFCIHVQVSTRLILSACPYLYIYIAKTHRMEVCEYRNLKIDFPLYSSSIYAWAFGYFIVGSIMFPLGLPWT